MNKLRWIVLLLIVGLSLGACAPTPSPTACAECDVCEECPPGEPPIDATPTCDAGTPPADEVRRIRAWLLFNALDPADAVGRLSALDDYDDSDFTRGGDSYVIVRADIVAGDENFNLLVPVDAADDAGFEQALGILVDKVGEPLSILKVDSYAPDPPHSAHTFISPGEYWGYPAPEYCPPGRHPQSPGSNPWG